MTTHEKDGEDVTAHEHIHMPPNSFVPLSLSLSLTLTMVGLVLSPFAWVIGLVWTVATLVVWARAARREYLDLPE